MEARNSWQADLIASVYKNKWKPDQQQDLKSFSTRLSELSAEQRSQVLADRILDMIHFAELNDRYEAIPEAYRRTFAWIFQEEDSASPSALAPPKLRDKDSFVKWLRSETPLYWITGKPGSGKSTLMKYLYQHPDLCSHLQHWHKDHPLIMAGFFFWNSGTNVQMSQAGLVRSLLYQILDKNRGLLPLAFPKRWESYELIGGDADPFTWTELITAVEILVSDTSRYYFFSIDGLDEFEGDAGELVQFVTKLSCHTNVKICTSSRPYLAFEEEFSSGPWLRLESLTYSDIAFFVKDKMEQSKMFATIQSFMPDVAYSLIHEITERASGVFLWVHIVVKSLLEGLRDGDTIEGLYERLRALPSDLEELFRKILHRLNPFNFKQSCEVFLLHKAASLPITLLDLALAKEGCDKALRAPLRPFTDAELEYYAENMRRFLNSRCKGLLEAPDVATKKHEAKVQYLHRTVRDFFQQDSVMDYIKSGVLDTFDPVLQLSAAYLVRIKSTQLRPSLIMVDDFWCAFLKAVHNASQITSTKTHSMFLDQLEETSSLFWKQKMQLRNTEMTCLDVIIRQVVPEQALYNSSLAATDLDEAASKFWGNTCLYTSSDVQALPGAVTEPVTSFFELATQIDVQPYVKLRLERERNLISRITPASKLKKNEATESKPTENGRIGSTHRSWFKRLSKGKA